MTDNEKYELAFEYYKNEEYEKSFEIVAKLEKDGNASQKSNILKGYLLLVFEKFDEVITHYKELREKTIYQLGYLKIFGDEDDEEKNTNKENALIYDLATINDLLLYTYIEVDKKDEALEMAVELLQLTDIKELVYNNIAKAFFVNEIYEEAFEMLNLGKEKEFETQDLYFINVMGRACACYASSDTNNLKIVLDEIIEYFETNPTPPYNDVYKIFGTLADIIVGLNLKEYEKKFLNSKILKYDTLRYYFKTSFALINGDEEEAKKNVKAYKESAEKELSPFQEYWEQKDIEETNAILTKLMLHPPNLPDLEIQKFYESVYGKIEFEK